MATLNIDGHGSFTLNPEQTQALLSWLEQNGVAKTVNTEGSSFEGKTLLNETEQKPKGSGPSEPSTYNFGTTWI